jgi:hypothetical protein
MAEMRRFYEGVRSLAGILEGMETVSPTDFGLTRAITVVVSEAEWRALLAIEPHPVAWVRQLIRDRLERATRESDPAAELV